MHWYKEKVPFGLINLPEDSWLVIHNLMIFNLYVFLKRGFNSKLLTTYSLMAVSCQLHMVFIYFKNRVFTYPPRVCSDTLVVRNPRCVSTDPGCADYGWVELLWTKLNQAECSGAVELFLNHCHFIQPHLFFRVAFFLDPELSLLVPFMKQGRT